MRFGTYGGEGKTVCGQTYRRIEGSMVEEMTFCLIWFGVFFPSSLFWQFSSFLKVY